MLAASSPSLFPSHNISHMPTECVATEYSWDTGRRGTGWYPVEAGILNGELKSNLHYIKFK